MMAICPYCKKEIDYHNIVVEKFPKKVFNFGREMYSCPHCNSVLGFAGMG
jgi:uncharacterized protein with PIN domain